jgi:small subunit ribosomal protein S20
MPIIKSAKKRVRVAKRQSTENARTKKSLRNAIKSFQSAVTNKKNVDATHDEAQSALDTAVKKGVISKNKAARKKSQLNAAAKEANGGKRKTAPKATKKAPAKSTAKKPTTKKTPAKTSAKKPAAKKTTKK